MSPFITNTMRRFSKGSSVRNSQNSTHSASGPAGTATGATAAAPGGSSSQRQSGSYTPPFSAAAAAHPESAPNGGAIVNPNVKHDSDSRPISAASNSSFDFMNRPASGTQHMSMPSSAIGGLSRTDQVVLRYFWEDKYQDNAKRDLHFLKFPFFGQYPSHADLMPYCEIYHLVKTSPGASIISLGSANGVYIGFELAQGAQLHIDMDDEWRDISHHRVIFKPYEAMLRDPTSDATFKAWPKPLTIEFLEDQYRKWMTDLTSFCWVDEPVRELGTGTGPNGGPDSGSEKGAAVGGEL